MLVAETDQHAIEEKSDVKDGYDRRELLVNRFIRERSAELTPAHEAPTASRAVETLAFLVSKMPTQSRRTIEQQQFQQFSTPPHYGYVVAWVANLVADDVVLEPSAGIGGLLVFAMNAGCKCYANELSDRRAELLESLVGDDVTVYRENAEHIHDLLPDEVRPSVVLMNPPFSATAGRMGDAKVRETAGLHLAQSLLRLRPRGRLVAIVGGGMSFDSRQHCDWWTAIGKLYTVRANVLVPGAEYAKYGTTFDTRILVIDNCGPTVDEPLAKAVVSVSELIEVLDPVRKLRIHDNGEIGADLFNAEPERPEPAVPPEAGQNGKRRRVVRAPKADPAPAAQVSSLFSDPLIAEKVIIEVVDSASAQAMGGGVFERYEPRRFRVNAKPHPTPLVESGAMASVLPPPVRYKPSLPKSFVESGKVSDAQLEAVIYAGQAFEQILPSGERRGFFIGDGTGVGKGRENCAIIVDDWMRRGGPYKALWVSKNQRLLRDARRDWVDIGGDVNDVFSLSDYKLDENVDRPTGIMFATFDTLKSGQQAESGPRKVKPAEIAAMGYPLHIAKRLATVANAPANDTLMLSHDISILSGDYYGFSLWRAIRHIDPNLPERKLWNDPFPTVSRELVLQALGFDIESLTPKRAGADRRSRLEQVTTWLGEGFDGVMVFDEAHQARNSLDDEG